MSTELAKQQSEIESAKSAGLAHWIENGVVKTAPPVDPGKFGAHSYGMRGSKAMFPLGSCAFGCGCSMAQSSSRGPVDPFGPCPKNPKA